VAALEALVAEAGDREEDALVRNIDWLAGDLGLDPLDRAVLEIALRYPCIAALETLADDLGKEFKSLPRALALLLGCRRQELDSRLRRDGPLVESGLLTVNAEGEYLTSGGGCESDFLQVPAAVRRNLPLPFPEPAALNDAIFGRPAEASLEWQDFAHLGAERDLMGRALKGAVEQRARGINLLLYGPPGSGKTEFCKTLAEHLGLTLFAVGESGTAGGELHRDGRLAALRLMQRLATRRRGTLLLFDEMEDLQPGRHGPYGGPRTRSKVFFNRLLEDNPVPVLWTANDIGRFEPALLRRMTLVIEMKVPGPRERARVWRRMVARSPLEGDPATLSGLAEELEVAPAVAANALRAAELAEGSLEDVARAARGVAKALRGGRPLPPPHANEAPFDFRLARADMDLQGLVARVTPEGAPRAFSFCLTGPPGTGKSEFARHLALAMGLRPLKKRVSDLFSMWVGETERQIAEAFEAAREQDGLLIFDEADALLAERAGARASWEVSQVAEMLTWMEAHPLPFCCTTNLVERLDRASLRRFTFKVAFRPLDQAQVVLAFRVFFGLAAPGPALALDNLTPGDFATVRRKARILDLGQDAGALARMLAAESAAKPDHTRPIGFLRQEQTSSEV
jgi:SpoVK/Ycf46/Vps4 family AAA+-type ATPase